MQSSNDDVLPVLFMWYIEMTPVCRAPGHVMEIPQFQHEAPEILATTEPKFSDPKAFEKEPRLILSTGFLIFTLPISKFRTRQCFLLNQNQ